MLCTFNAGGTDVWSNAADWVPNPPDDSGTDTVTISRGSTAVLDVADANIAALTLPGGSGLGVDDSLTVGVGGVNSFGGTLDIFSELKADNITSSGPTTIEEGGTLEVTGATVGDRTVRANRSCHS